MNTCETCGKETSNPKFCSRSCSAIFNNKAHPKRIKQGICEICGSLSSSTKKVCESCYKSRRCVLENKKLNELKNKNQVVRHHSRTIALENTADKSCMLCGYDKHVQACHIKPVSEFDENCTVAEVNALENLILLCPNCHWEFDNGLIDKSFLN